MDRPPRLEPAKETAGERFRTWALDCSRPNNMLQSKASHSHLGQDASDHCFYLLPQQLEFFSASTSQLVNLESRVLPLNIPILEGPLLSPGSPRGSLVSSVPLGSQPLGGSPSSTGLPSFADLAPTRLSSDFLPSGQSIVSPCIESPEAIFTAALGSSEEKRVKRLVVVARAFSEAKEFSDGFCRRFWSRWPPIFRSEPEVGFEDGSFEAGVAYRLRRLKQARQNIRKRDWEANRLWLICLAHEVEHISQWEGINQYTSRGIDRMCAAITMAEKYLATVKDDHKRSRNIVQILKEAGPATLLLEDGGTPRSTWEKFMTLNDITIVFTYRKDRYPHLDEQARSHDPDASFAIKDCFLAYGWSFSELLRSNTKVMVILKPYFQRKRPHSNSRSKDSESKHKRLCADRPGASASRPDHDFPLTSLIRFSPDNNDFDQAPSSGTYNTVESMLGWNSSHLISFDARNGTRNLADPKMVESLGCAVNSSGEISDLATTDFLQSTDNQSIDALSDFDYETKQLIDASVEELLWWNVNASNELTDPTTDGFLQEASSATHLYLTDDFIHSSLTDVSSLPNARTPGCIDPRTMSKPTAPDGLGRIDC